MTKFTPLEYLYIDIANAFGMDKDSWDHRIQWVKENLSGLEHMINIADEPILFAKAVHVLREVETGRPTGFIMGLDATASGLQIMSALSACHVSAANVNLIDTGKREDIYKKVANEMNKLDGINVTRSDVKQPLMTYFYGSKAQPKALFGEDSPELAAFYEILSKELSGPIDVLSIIQKCWNPEALEHSWYLPDGHKAVVKVMAADDKKIEVDELDHTTFTHRAYINASQPYGLSLCANVIHSIDGWIVREMVRRSDALGYQLVAIHDSFWCSPKYMNETRQLYVELLTEIASGDLLQSILRDITGRPIEIIKDNDTLPSKILDAEYALS